MSREGLIVSGAVIMGIGGCISRALEKASFAAPPGGSATLTIPFTMSR
jgi:hypothetical protein